MIPQENNELGSSSQTSSSLQSNNTILGDSGSLRTSLSSSNLLSMLQPSPRVETLEDIVNRKRQELQTKFSELDLDGDGYITQEDLKRYLSKFGLSRCPITCHGGRMSFVEFTQWMTTDKPNILQKSFTGQLAIPNFQDFCKDLSKMFALVHQNDKGILPDYIPELSNADPSLFGLSLCSVDGQVAHFGNGTKKVFTLQHCVLPMLYCLAREQGTDIHQFIGREPSGLKFNAFSLNEEKKPHNPFVSTGGLVCASQIQPKNSSSKRFTNIYQFIQKMAGCPTTLDSNEDSSQISYSQCTYLSEKEHNDRNRALVYFLRSNGVKGITQDDGCDINDVLDFYVQTNSISCTTRELSIIASTLANSGICPITSERCINDIHTVRDCLSLLYSCGMYDYSGTWAFTVGLPAKSGVSGCLMIIVPNVCGMAIYSPLVDKKGHSVRAVEICQMMSRKYNLSIFGGLMSGKLYNRKHNVFQ
ncbi:hypothetical protein FDP41_005948 [Naegleria fowleri]|uniref:glutaminase n=1 Tax=Naegleria fowleri TaxID=5763 RepID=A0A6A5BNN2_NAEFO|nr:uncharacterized protein FDP41_005948 [Naegleria fowleri]KAF0975195.1 hypothetical protein FDP41_005948 [Naegleria fowleri]CAG4713497.1 unnamed protein product [Naegleria fowleri]